jgi:hypothetical protein
MAAITGRWAQTEKRSGMQSVSKLSAKLRSRNQMDSTHTFAYGQCNMRLLEKSCPRPCSLWQ